MHITPHSLYQNDQRDRRRVFGASGIKFAPQSLIRELISHDEQRRKQLHDYLKRHALKTGQDYYYAAMLLQHGNNKKHYRKAYSFAKTSSRMGYKPAFWLTAATFDRYLKSLGRHQKYGTQFYIGRDGTWKIWPYSKRTTDEERRRFHVEPLKEMLAYAKRLNQAKKMR